ncbi:MAG: glucosamine/galactosamine-6-phosphate isomerase [Myxococcales bacterium]|nr:glucosamine/galactosamine-6-phosphate isomerase [Myxococcales bacterium]
MPDPQIERERDPAALARRAAHLIADAIALRPDAAIMVATGSTPMATYAELAEMRERGELDTSRVRAVQLDEYLGLTGDDDPRSLYGWMRRSFAEPLGIDDARVLRLDVSGDAEAGCRAFDEAIDRAGGLDLAILGLGPNGHLGFNEPPSQPDSPSRTIELTPESLASNAPYWGGLEHTPRRAATAGMRVIMQARAVLLLVSGAHKREILSRTLDEEPTPDVPSSLLRLRDGVTVVCDRASRAATEDSS